MKLVIEPRVHREAVDQAVRAELTRQLYGAPALHLIPVFVALVTARLLWPLFPHWMTVFWISGVMAASAARLTLLFAFRISRPDPDAMASWSDAFAFGTGASGLVWGLLAGAILVTRDSSVLVFVAYVIGGLVAGAAVLDSKSMPAFYAFVIPAAGPTAAAMLRRGGPKMVEMAVILIAFVVFLTIMARENHKTRAADIRNKLQLDRLNGDLERASARLAAEIAERIKMSESLADANLRLEAISHSAPDAIIISDSHDRVTAWNPAAERMFGYRAAEVIGRTLHDVIAPPLMRDGASRRFAAFVATTTAGSPGRVRSFTALRKDGSEFPADVSVSAMTVGGEVHALGIVRDISDRKAAEAALHEAVESLAEAQRIAHVGNWSANPVTGEVAFSDEALRIYGLETGEPGPNLNDHHRLMTADSFNGLLGAVADCSRTGLPFRIELELPRLDGPTRWAEATGEFHRTPRGELRIRGAIQDITERKTAADALRDEQTLFQRLVEQNTSGICIVTGDAGFTYINPRGLEMIGVSDAQEILGQPGWSFVGPKHRRAVGEAMTALFEGRQTFAELEVTVRPRDGPEVEALAQCTIATFRGARAMLAVVTDITERKRSQDRIARLNQEMAGALDILQRHERDLTMTARFSDLLQACRTTAEAYPIVGAAAKALFPEAAGALSLVERAAGQVVRVTRWGDGSRVSQGFGHQDCWALRSGHRHETDFPGDTPRCAHFTRPPDGPCLCLPLTVRGETLGLLTLEIPAGSAIDDELRQRMTAFGDMIKLSLANIGLLESLADQAMRDQLTGLFNRRYLAETLPREISRARRTGAPLTVAMLDIDHFKAFNDAHGHDAGDLVLRELAAALVASLRAGDVACRYGGEEFLLVLPDCTAESAVARLSRIAAVLRDRTFDFGDATLPGVTLSVGVAPIDDALQSADRLVTAADEALYLAKNRGRDDIEIYRPAAGMA